MAIPLREEESGAVVYQVTEDELDKSNIYCERCYCSEDSRFFLFTQRSPSQSTETWDYVLCEFGSWQTRVAAQGLSGPAMNHDGRAYYLRRAEKDTLELVRLDLATGETEVMFVLTEEDVRGRRGHGAMSAHERYYAYGVALGYEPQLFGIRLLDLRTGTRAIVNTDPYICNPHTQFEPSEGRQIAVQHNRGCRFAADGTRLSLYGEEGVTLYLVDVPGGEVTPLQVGPPYTNSTTGHEAWIGASKEILVSTRIGQSGNTDRGNLFAVGAGGPPRPVSGGYEFLHVNTSVCGRFFACDERGKKQIVIGSIRTGKNAVLCDSEASYQHGQPSHAHPYLSRDLKWVVFNSDRTGRTQIHVASVPEGLLESLERDA